jgi:hypothetical protein
MCMLRWACDHTIRDHARNDDTHERLAMALDKEKLVKYLLRWFGHIQRKPLEAPIRRRAISQTTNGKRGKGRSNLTWEVSMK